MVVRIFSLVKTLPAGAAETEVGTVTVPVGHTYNFLEVLFLVPPGSWLYVYVESDRVAAVHGDVIAKDNRRIVVNWSLTGGQTLRVSGTNATGSAQAVGAIVTVDDVVA